MEHTNSEDTVVATPEDYRVTNTSVDIRHLEGRETPRIFRKCLAQ